MNIRSKRNFINAHAKPLIKTDIPCIGNCQLERSVISELLLLASIQIHYIRLFDPLRILAVICQV